MKLAIGSDERTTLTDSAIAWLEEQGHELTYYGPLLPNDATLWPQVARQVAEAVANGDVDEGILFCWTGTGVSIAANKVPGVRAALCDDPETAQGARLWNDANIICLSLRRVSGPRATEILSSWFKHSYQPNPTDDTCLAQVAEIEQAYNHQPPNNHE